MPLATITEIRPNVGFNLDDGTRMYTNMIYFDDNTYGNANTKSQIAPYVVGEKVSYEITGNYKGTPKLKVSKSFAPARSAAPNPVSPQAQAPLTRTNEVDRINGATVGMAMNQTMQLLTRDLTHDEIVAKIITPVFWSSVLEVASDIIRVSQHLESGHLSPSVRDRIAGFRSANVSQTRPSEPLHRNPPDDEDVPF